MMRLDKILLFGVMIFLPFDATEYLHINMGLFSVAAVDIMIIMALFATITRQLVTQAPLRLNANIAIFFLLAIVFSLTNLAWLRPSASDIKITCNFIEYLILFYICSQVIREEVFLKRLLWVFLISTVLLSTVNVLTSLGMNLGMGGYIRKDRISVGVLEVGVLGLTDQFAKFSLFITGALPFALENTLIKRQWLRLGLALLLFTAAIVTLARGLYLALLGEMLVWLYLGYFRTLTSRKRLIALTGMSLIILLLSIAILPLMEFLINIRPGNYDNRLLNYSLALQSSTSDFFTFLFGLGRSNFIQFVSPTHMPPHNIFLDILVNKGMMTLAWIVSVVFIIFFRLLVVPGGLETVSGQLRIPLTIGLLGMIFVGLLDSTTTSITFWTYLALVYAFTLIPRKRTQTVSVARSTSYPNSWVKI